MHIKDLVEKGEEIPEKFLDLAEMSTEPSEYVDIDPGNSNPSKEDEVFFPMLSNEEQSQIVDKVRTTDGVLVQGPPGTGKSHTIANLICHLLASGSRILVTAKTPRALQVLEGLLPDEIKPLCINLLGSGPDERKALQSSVGGILGKRNVWDIGRAENEIKQLNIKTRKLREEKAEIDRQLRAIRESETYSQSIAEGAYQGTASQIARRVKALEEECKWFTDDIPFDWNYPTLLDDIEAILVDLRNLTPSIREQLARERPKDLLTPEQFAVLVNDEIRAIEDERTALQEAESFMAELYKRSNDGTTSGLQEELLYRKDLQAKTDSLTKVKIANILALQESLLLFMGTRAKLLNLDLPWLRQAINDVTSSNASIWHKLLHVTRQLDSDIGEMVAKVDSSEVEIPVNVNRIVLLEDAQNKSLC